MSASLSLSVTTPLYASSSGYALVEWRTPAACAAYVLEISFSYASATAAVQNYFLAVPAIRGIGPVETAFQQDNPSDPASLVTGAVSWSGGAPTYSATVTNPANYLRGATNTNAIGKGHIWTFPTGIYIPPSSSLVLFSTSGLQHTLTINCVIA